MRPEIWINPACSKCQTALSDEELATLHVRYYLKEPPTAAELVDLLDRLGLEPWEITRQHEPDAATLLQELTPEPAQRRAWISALCAHPHLLTRPIVTVSDSEAFIVRDSASIAEAKAALASAQPHQEEGQLT